MKTLEMLWAACPGETMIYGSIALASAALMAVPLAAAMLPTEPDEFEEASEC